MQESTSKGKILTKIRKSLIRKIPNPYPKTDFESPIYSSADELLEVCFAQELKKVNGEFVYCENEKELCNSLHTLIHNKKLNNIFCWDKEVQKYLISGSITFSVNDTNLNSIDAGITSCEFLIARTGSVLVSSAQDSGRRLTIYPPVHIVIATISQLVYDMKTALIELKKKYTDKLPSMITAITGPSRTADIEKTLVLGAHGPKELFVFLLDKKN